MTIRDDVTRVLACSALVPGLRAVLVFDAAPDVLRGLADVWAQMLEAALGRKVAPQVLAAGESEESLWGTWQPCAGSPPFCWVPGPLAPPDGDPLPVFVIADLASLNLATARACVAAVGADVVHLEREGRSLAWPDRACWLAGCRREDVGRVSRHLLDRFALRLSAPPLPGGASPVEALRAGVAAGRAAGDVAGPVSLTPPPRDELAAAGRRRPPLTDEASERIEALTRSDRPVGLRRALTLARLASAAAALEGHDPVGDGDLDEAARLLGLGPSPNPPPPPGLARVEPPPDETALKQPPDQGENALVTPVFPGRAEDDRTETGTSSRPVRPPPGKPQPALTVPGADVAHPEDTAPVRREAGSLRLPALTARGKTVPRGAVIGSAPTRDLHDLAVVPTLLEAARFAAVRRRAEGRPADAAAPRLPLRVTGGDLRRHRRAPVPERLLALLLDYTALRGDAWEEELLRYLHRAYVNRAAVCVVQVGAAGTEEPWRATRVLGRNLLAPAVAAALAPGRGGATPLAHGLELAGETIRRALHRGRGAVTEATLVVYTDGRGNVPLAASLAAMRPGQVGREGVTDALAAAGRLRGLQGLTAVVLDPEPLVYPRLPEELAVALGASVVKLRSDAQGGRP
jgi:magnesium chelatase subunit D